MLIACIASFAIVSMVGFYYLTESETSRLRQQYYEDAGHITNIVRDQFFEVYRDLEDATLFISQLIMELDRLEGVRHLEVYDRFARLQAQSDPDDPIRPNDYELHRYYAEKVIATGKTLSMEHIPEGILEIIAPLFMAGDEHGGSPIGAVTLGMDLEYKGEESIQKKSEMLTDVMQLAVGRSASHLEIERFYVDSITRRLGKLKGLASLTVYDKDLKVMANSEPGHIGDDAAGIVVSRLRSVISSAEDLEIIDENKSEMVKYMPIILMTESGDDYVAAVVEMSLDVQYIEGVVAAMRGKMVRVALAIILFAMLCMWIALRLVVVLPVKRLTDMTAAVGRGEFDVKIDRSSNDELGLLGNSFNKMTDELKYSRDELLAARNFNEEVLASLYEALVVVSNEGRVIMCNQAAEEMLHYNTQELERMHVSSFLPGWQDVLTEVRSQGVAVFSENTFVTNSGNEIPVSLSATEMSSKSLGLLFGFVMVASDISERKRAEADLREYTSKLEAYTAELVETDKKMRESEERFRLAFETGPDPIMLTRLRDGLYIDVNNGFVDMTGYRKEMVIGRSSYDEVDLWADQVERDAFLELMDKHGGQRSAPMTIVSRDGSVRDCLASASVFELSDEPHLLTILRDVSELKQAQRERDMLNSELIQKNRELEQLVYVSSHDLRSPLVNVQGFSREIAMDFADLAQIVKGLDMPKEDRVEADRIIDTDVPSALGYISASIQKMDIQLKGLLKLSRLGRVDVNIRQLNMDDIVGEVLKNFNYRIKEENIKVETMDLPECVGDGELVSQALFNIVDNALKYMDIQRRGILSISGRTEGGSAVYCIRDNGKGIRKDYQDKIFEIFHRLEPDTSVGEGLGLSIVQKSINKCGGRVWVESEEGKGSRFYIEMPLSVSDDADEGQSNEQ